MEKRLPTLMKTCEVAAFSSFQALGLTINDYSNNKVMFHRLREVKGTMSVPKHTGVSLHRHDKNLSITRFQRVYRRIGLSQIAVFCMKGVVIHTI